MAKIPYKTKEELDALSYEEFRDYRISLIIKNRNEDKRYISELNYYDDLRDRPKQIARYTDWERKSKITKKVKFKYSIPLYHDETNDTYFSENDMQTYVLLLQVADKFGRAEFVDMLLAQTRERIGESKYNLYE